MSFNHKNKRAISTLAIVLILLFPFVGIVLGSLIASNLFVPIHVVQRISMWGDPSGEPGLVIFTIKSKGTFTANYPVEVEIEIMVGEDISGYFQDPSKKIELIVSESYQYPIAPSPEGRIPAGTIPISEGNRKGRGTIIFPYPGSFSTYFIYVDDVPVWAANFSVQNEPSIFTIEDHSVRLQIENANRSIGIAIVSLSITVFGLIFAVLKKIRPF